MCRPENASRTKPGFPEAAKDLGTGTLSDDVVPLAPERRRRREEASVPIFADPVSGGPFSSAEVHSSSSRNPIILGSVEKRSLYVMLGSSHLTSTGQYSFGDAHPNHNPATE